MYNLYSSKHYYKKYFSGHCKKGFRGVHKKCPPPLMTRINGEAFFVEAFAIVCLEKSINGTNILKQLSPKIVYF